MRYDRLQELEESLLSIVGSKNFFSDEQATKFYSTGIRVGAGCAAAVVFPRNLLQFWKTLDICSRLNKIIIIQAANTGLTGGSTPYGNDYDRDIVIINTLKIDNLILLNKGLQVIAFPGTTLYQLERDLAPLNRSPHSIIGSSCIGASVIGGICNNSGGNLVNRGPAYTQLSLFARLSEEGNLELVNHLGIELGDTPEEIFYNLENVEFNSSVIQKTDLLASDNEYQIRVRDINANTPARFNADKRRLYEASGCAGKLAVFAVRLDTFPTPKEQKVFFVGTNDPEKLNTIRKTILKDFTNLPDMGEYMHSSYFDGADKYCKDTFLLIKYLGTNVLPKLFLLKRLIDRFLSNIFLLPEKITDRLLQLLSSILPDHLPFKIRSFRSRFEHFMLILASEESIKDTEKLLSSMNTDVDQYDYLICSNSEGKDLLLHRYVAGSAPARYALLNAENSGELLPLDVALPRNFDSWYKFLPSEISEKIACSFRMGHFLCMVFHWDFVLKNGEDSELVKSQILTLLDKAGAKYPAEHNVGHLYKADFDLANFYKKIDPTNSFNTGIGQTSKKKNYI